MARDAISVESLVISLVYVKEEQESKQQQSNFVEDDADEVFVAKCRATSRPAKKFLAHLHIVHNGKSKIVRAQINSASNCNTMPSNLFSQSFINLKV